MFVLADQTLGWTSSWTSRRKWMMENRVYVIKQSRRDPSTSPLLGGISPRKATFAGFLMLAPGRASCSFPLDSNRRRGLCSLFFLQLTLRVDRKGSGVGASACCLLQHQSTNCSAQVQITGRCWQNKIRAKMDNPCIDWLLSSLGEMEMCRFIDAWFMVNWASCLFCKAGSSLRAGTVSQFTFILRPSPGPG